MVTTQELRTKEVINMVDGSRIGYIYDFEINLEKNRIEAIVVPREGRFLKFFNKENDYIISWKKIVKVGQDIILVELKDSFYEEIEEKQPKNNSFLFDNIDEEDIDKG